MRTVSIFGATGSVGESTLDLIRRNRDRFRVVALTANGNAVKLAELAREFGAELAVVADESAHAELRDCLSGTGVKAEAGADALVAAARIEVDWTMAAIVGCAGLAPTMAALERGGAVALANKEALVSAGELMTAIAERSGATLLPVDSEHNAIFQCLHGRTPKGVRRIILTASGGPFRTANIAEMEAMSPEQAVAHPNWSMGAKISVDSATMMNKGLELIEAYHLFPVGLDRIEILVHPQSVIHSMVEFDDRSTLAQLGEPDMRVPIAHALAWPERMETPCRPLDLAAIGRLDFEAPDTTRFPCIALARQAIAAGGSRPAVLNAANEVAVERFLKGEVGFCDIARIVSTVLDSYEAAEATDLGSLLEIDADVRRVAADVAVERKIFT